MDIVCLTGTRILPAMNTQRTTGTGPGEGMDAELAALARQASLEELRRLAEVFRRWDHQLAVAESVRATRPDAFIILEPELHLRTRQAEPAEIQALREDLRRWDRQLRQAYGWRLSRREAGRMLSDFCGAQKRN